MLTLGWKASAEQFGPQELLDYGVMAEQHGFDSIVVSDHFHPWKDTDGHAPFSFTWLGAMGARTTRAKLGTSVVTPTFRYHPATVAQAFPTLDVLIPNLEKGAREAGRDSSKIEKMIEIKVSYDTDRDRALEDTREWAALALPAEDKAGVEDPREMERRAAGAADEAYKRFIVTD